LFLKKTFYYPLTVIYYLAFGLILIIFHLVQVFSFRLLGYASHKKSVDWLNFFLLRCLNILGTSFEFSNPFKMPENGPLIIVSNHQSTYDIPPIIWYFRKYHPKFISKSSLGKGIPSVSFNLRHGGSESLNTYEESLRSLALVVEEVMPLTICFNKASMVLILL